MVMMRRDESFLLNYNCVILGESEDASAVVVVLDKTVSSIGSVRIVCLISDGCEFFKYLGFFSVIFRDVL